MEWRSEGYTLSDDRERLDMECVVAAVQGSYWATDRPRPIIEESFRNSLCFGLFEGERQIGSRARQRTKMIEAVDEQKSALATEPAIGGLQPERAAQRGGHADRTIGIGAKRERHQTACHRGSRAS